VQQLCRVQCTHIRTDLTVVCWLDLAFLWLHCVLQFICVRFGFFVIILCYNYLCMYAFVVLDLVSSLLCQEIGYENVYEMTYLCRVGCKTLTQSTRGLL